MQPSAPGLAGVKHTIAVASGKGGVGKSTTTANLALALTAQGHRVGVLDADIYGPSMGMMLGIDASVRPEQVSETSMLPVMAKGVKVMSISLLIDEKTAVIWRAPMASSALQQLLTQTVWGALDYLLIDMPPGTGDIQLTLSQKAALSGAVIVTTPQDIALLDVQKGIEMFRKVSIPVLGVVENMSTHICSACGHEEPVFGQGGAQRIAREYGVPQLGALPLALAIREHADMGQPIVDADPQGALANHYHVIAERLTHTLDDSAKTAPMMPQLHVVDD